MTYDESGIPMTDSEILADYRLYVQYMAAIMSERIGGHNADEWLDDEATDRKIISGVRMLRENPQLVADVLKQTFKHITPPAGTDLTEGPSGGYAEQAAELVMLRRENKELRARLGLDANGGGLDTDRD